jgi:predicted phosphodiesterase
MRIQVASDLHLEFSPDWELPETGADVLVLAGDISTRTLGLEAFRNRTARQAVIYVPGNHEYYSGSLSKVAAEMRDCADLIDMHLLDNDELIIGGVRFLGATLWTDFVLFGEARRAETMAAARRRVTDFSVISYGTTGWLTPEQTVAFHQQSVHWLRTKLAEPFAGRTVVVTHHAPHLGSLHPRFKESPISPAFVSNLEELMGHSALWIHGHTHDSFDYAVKGTRVICNPRGYDPFELNPAFVADLVIEV